MEMQRGQDSKIYLKKDKIVLYSNQQCSTGVSVGIDQWNKIESLKIDTHTHTHTHIYG